MPPDDNKKSRSADNNGEHYSRLRFSCLLSHSQTRSLPPKLVLLCYSFFLSFFQWQSNKLRAEWLGRRKMRGGSKPKRGSDISPCFTVHEFCIVRTIVSSCLVHWVCIWMCSLEHCEMVSLLATLYPFPVFHSFIYFILPFLALLKCSLEPTDH